VHVFLRRGLALAAVPALVLAACGDDDGDDSAGGDDQTSVVASFYPIAEAASSVGGDQVDVTNLTPAGTEPHDMELTPDLVDELEDADLVLYLGQGFQPAVEEIAEGRDGPSIDLLESIELQAGGTEALEAEEAAGGEHAEEEGGEEHAESELDPHFWLDPQLLSSAVDEVESALAEVAPDDASTFRSNAESYRAQLAALDEELATGLTNCERDDIVTSHAAFFYLAERYGLTQLPIAGVSPEAEPDAGRLDELADLIESEGITTVFFETLVSPDVAETLARETDAETAVLNPIEGLTEEQLDDGDDYASVMRENLAVLQEALGCS
jgi:zinc transport system substrate-binding protein